ncbi:hypothetical protein, partial [Ferrimicrobium acidiphilum]|uniref:hypothetical protein n=1 Tax=Ferrimicrobium acidiphilum TaxID=121039 RepID=UPI0034DDC6CA
MRNYRTGLLARVDGHSGGLLRRRRDQRSLGSQFHCGWPGTTRPHTPHPALRPGRVGPPELL